MLDWTPRYLARRPEEWSDEWILCARCTPDEGRSDFQDFPISLCPAHFGGFSSRLISGGSFPVALTVPIALRSSSL